jgi:elongator complex protein 3
MPVLHVIIITRSFFITEEGAEGDLDEQQRAVAAIAEIVSELALAQREGRDVQLNRMKTKISSKHGLQSTPRLTDIIAAVPPELKKLLLPKLKAKPVRTASGVSESTMCYYYYIVQYMCTM